LGEVEARPVAKRVDRALHRADGLALTTNGLDVRDRAFEVRRCTHDLDSRFAEDREHLVRVVPDLALGVFGDGEAGRILELWHPTVREEELHDGQRFVGRGVVHRAVERRPSEIAARVHVRARPDEQLDVRQLLVPTGLVQERIAERGPRRRQRGIGGQRSLELGHVVMVGDPVSPLVWRHAHSLRSALSDHSVIFAVQLPREEPEGPMTEAFIYDAIRTPRGRGKKDGALHEVKPISLVTGLIDEVRARNPQLDPNLIDDVVLGVVTPVADQGANIAKTAAIAAKLPDTVAGVQVNRFCASGLEAVNLAAQKVRSGFEEFVLAGGVESMSRIQMGMDGGAWPMDPMTNYDTGFVPQGIGADLIATIEGFSREDVDRYAVTSQQRAATAWKEGYFKKSVVPVRDRNGVTILDRDEHVKPNTTLETLAKLQPAFVMMGEMGGFDAVALQKYHYIEAINHVHTAGNSSGIVDGAALVLVGSDKKGKELGLKPRARIVATALSGADPTIMLVGPGPASRKALQKAGMKAKDIDLWEVNEAFASVVMRFEREMEISHDIVNVNGGAIAMGHPLGATGAMILGTLVDELERRGKRYGLATLCVGGGMGIATIVERL
jgi:acetyl-CoA C-acetyltransferase